MRLTNHLLFLMLLSVIGVQAYQAYNSWRVSEVWIETMHVRAEVDEVLLRACAGKDFTPPGNFHRVHQ